MKNIYIMLTQVGTIISRSIKLYTKAKYNHVSLGVDGELRTFYSFARRIRFFPVVGGFITESVNEGMYKYYPETECLIYALEVEDHVYNRVILQIDKYIKSESKYGYNLLGFFGILFNRPIERKNKNTCAEFIAKVLHEADIYTFPKHFSLVRPDEIKQIPGLTVVYEGKMHHLGKSHLRYRVG